jgi:hypothetical protein
MDTEHTRGHIMTRAEIEAILAGTKGVTPGPWEIEECENRDDSVGQFTSYAVSGSVPGSSYRKNLVDTLNSSVIELHVEYDEDGHSAWDEQGAKDAAHIARLDPQTVSALCTALIESMDRVEELEFGLAAAVQIAGEAAEEWDKAPEGMRAGKILLALAGHRPRYRPDTDAIHAALAARKSLGGSNER